MRAMVEQWLRLLDQLLASPRAPLASLSLLSDAQRLRLLSWHGPACPFPAELGAHQLVEQQAARSPHALALVCGQQRLTYAQLLSLSSRLARLLRSRGLGPGSLVALSLTRSPWLLVSLLGVLQAGAAYLPLDPTYPPDRLAFMLQDARVAALLTEQALDGALPSFDGLRLRVDQLPPEGLDPAPLASGVEPGRGRTCCTPPGRPARPRGWRCPTAPWSTSFAASPSARGWGRGTWCWRSRPCRSTSPRSSCCCP